MIINTDISAEKEEFVFSPPEFQLASPGESPFEALPATSITGVKGSFNLNWVENPIEIGISKSQKILDDIVKRSRLDVERFPSDAAAHANLALALMNRGLLDEAANELLAALGLSPRHFMSLANLARVRLLQNRFAEAEGIYRNLCSAFPHELSPLVNLSYILLRTHRVDEATHILKQAISIDDKATFPRYLMAVSLLTLGKPHEAIRHLRVAARSDVRSPAIHQTLGAAYLIAGDAKGAVRAFKTALTLAPDMKQAIHGLANVLLRQNNTESLVELLSAYLDKWPDDSAAREILAETHWRRREYSAARSQLTTASRYIHGTTEGEQRQRARLLNNLGACSERLGDPERAAQSIGRSIQVCSTFDPIPYHNIAKLEMRRQRYPQALEILDTCRSIFPENRETAAVQAAVLADQHRYDEAIKLLYDETAKKGASSTSYALLGWFLADFKSDPKAAARVLSEGIRIYPDSAKIINNLAYALLTEGYTKEARNVLMSFDRSNDIPLEDDIALIATWGLLHLWEGEFAIGKRHYEKAAEMARESPVPNLPAIVHQKMHLELARASVRSGDIQQAKISVSRGLSIKSGREVYQRDLIKLGHDLETNLTDERGE